MKKEQISYLQIEEFTIEVTRKKIKNLYLRIKPPEGEICISAPLFVSDEQIVAFVKERVQWIRKGREKCLQQPKEPFPKLTKEQEKLIRKRLETEAWELIRKWEPLMGVKVTGVTIRKMKTRWGSCNVRTGHININFELAWKEKEQLTYVVVHEMCHLLEPSHNKVFWAYMDRFFPDWKCVRQSLKA